MIEFIHPRIENLEPEMALNHQYLHLNLIRIDLLVRCAVRKWEISGQDFSEKFKGLFVTEKSIKDLLSKPIGGNWGAGVDLPKDEIKQIHQLKREIEAEILNLRKKATSENIELRLDQLRSIFHLSEFEFDAFLIFLAPSLDTRYEKIYGFLQDDVTNKFASVSLVFDLSLQPGLEKLSNLRFFQNSSHLLKNGLIKNYFENQSMEKPLIKQNFIIPDEIISWLLGNYQPAKLLSKVIEISNPGLSNKNHSEIFDLPEKFDSILDQYPLMILFGQDELQKQLISNHIARISNQSLLNIDLRLLDPTLKSNNDILDTFIRDAKLTNSIPVIIGLDQVVEDVNEINFLFQQFSEYEGTIIILTNRNWPIIRKETQMVKPVYWLDCKNPTNKKRIEIWKRYLADDLDLEESDLVILANQFDLNASQIQNSVYSAFDIAFRKGTPISIDDLYEAARLYSSHHLNNLATKIQPRYQWEDIVLPEDGIASLRELTNTIRWRTVVLEEWGVGKRLMPYAGVSALFAGPPGTGKTLAAQVIASELKMDLFKIDLSTVVSKYIGETEKNLERIFSQAKNSNAILFFDEADSIFGKRSEVKDAHDRYANIEVGYLLQRMETYDGVVILATNLRSNMDDAFTRRIQFIIDFPFPDEKERQRIWKVLFPPEVPKSEDINIEELGNRFKLTGGSIRNVIINASFLAASENNSVSNKHLVHAIRREMQKMGRLVNDQDLIMLNKEGNNGKNAK